MHQLESGCQTWKVYRFPLSIFIPKTLMRALHVNSDRMRALVVGGSVRDAILGYESKDLDLEVYGIDYENLAAVLQQYGRLDLVGKKFGVITGWCRPCGSSSSSSCRTDGAPPGSEVLPTLRDLAGIAGDDSDMQRTPTRAAIP